VNLSRHLEAIQKATVVWIFALLSCIAFGAVAATQAHADIMLSGASLAVQTGEVTLDANHDITIQNGITRHAAINDSYSKSGDLLTMITTTQSSRKSVRTCS